MKLTEYIRKPELLDATAVEELSQLVERYPYFQTARLLLLRGLYQLQDERFGPLLRQSAIYVPDRAKLFQLIEGYKYQVSPELRHRHVRQTDEPTIDRTQSLIESFLSSQPESPQQRRTQPVDVTTDYMAYLEQMDDLPDADTSGQTAIIDEFMDRTGGRITLPQGEPDPLASTAPSGHPDSLEEEPRPEPNGADGGEEPLGVPIDDKDEASDDYFTETLARIYVKQGKYNKAIEIIRRINLNYPKKSAYFADQIRFLEKLALNERYRKGAESVTKQ